MVHKGVSHQVEWEWYNMQQSIIEETEEMIGEIKNRKMKNGIMTNIAKL
jgi:hypothetical protein